jgi:hypothetical protein
MCSHLSHRLLSCVLATSLLSCGGGDLVLPDDKAPVALQAVSGDGQEATVGSRLPDPLVVLLTDGAARPVAGVPLTFRFRDDVPDAEIDPASVETDESGRASARVTLGATTGPHTVEAVVAQGPSLSTTFGVTAVAKRGGGGGGGDDDDDDD